MADRVAAGNYAATRGMSCSFARFTDEEVARMREMIAEGMKQREIAALFECSQSYISAIARGKIRAHPTSEPSPAILAQREREARASANRQRIDEIISVVHPDDEIVGEEWRPTPFEGYMVSSLGRVRGRTMIILKLFIREGDYAIVHCGNRNPQAVHILVCEAWHGPRPAPGMHAAHRNGDSMDNSPENLRWATPLENIGQDRLRHGTVLRGADANGAKLTQEQVNAIRAQLPGTRGIIARLAREYGVVHGTIRAIRDNLTWRELNP
ncbi:HNH endonuclease [Arthrobacter sp. PvP023]|nr:HNH endonuclease [Arthrobacter sp. PvP023]